MARCDYYQIELELGDIILSDSTLQGVKAVVEDQPIFADESPIIAIYLERRDPGDQYLANGQVQQYNLTLSLWTLVFGFELDAAIKKRDDVLGKLELVLMQNRTINGFARMSYLMGGEMLPASKPQDGGVIVGAETRLMVDVAFTT